MGLSTGEISVYGIVWLILLLPLVHAPFLFNGYEFPKFILFTGGAQLLILFQCFETLKHIQNIAYRRDFLTASVLCFGLATLLANLFGLDPKISLLGSQWRYQGFLTLTAGILIFLIVRSFAKQEKKRLVELFYQYLPISAILICLFAINPTAPTYQGRIIGTFGNPNFLGGYLAMLLPFLFLSKPRIVQAIAIVFSLLVILLTQSISAVLAAGVVLVAYAMRKAPHVAWVFLLLFAAGAVAAALFLFVSLSNRSFSAIPHTYARNCLYYLPKNGLDMFALTLFEQYPVLQKFSLCEGRPVIWAYAIDAIQKRPILGYGQENVALIIGEKLKRNVDSSHNIFLETAFASGIIGLSLFVAIILLAIRRASISIRLSLIASLIVAFFNPVSIVHLALFWFLLGLSNGIYL